MHTNPRYTQHKKYKQHPFAMSFSLSHRYGCDTHTELTKIYTCFYLQSMNLFSLVSCTCRFSPYASFLCIWRLLQQPGWVACSSFRWRQLSALGLSPRQILESARISLHISPRGHPPPTKNTYFCFFHKKTNKFNESLTCDCIAAGPLNASGTWASHFACCASNAATSAFARFKFLFVWS